MCKVSIVMRNTYIKIHRIWSKEKEEIDPINEPMNRQMDEQTDDNYILLPLAGNN